MNCSRLSRVCLDTTTKWIFPYYSFLFAQIIMSVLLKTHRKKDSNCQINWPLVITNTRHTQKVKFSNYSSISSSPIFGLVIPMSIDSQQSPRTHINQYTTLQPPPPTTLLSALTTSCTTSTICRLNEAERTIWDNSFDLWGTFFELLSMSLLCVYISIFLAAFLHLSLTSSVNTCNTQHIIYYLVYYLCRFCNVERDNSTSLHRSTPWQHWHWLICFPNSPLISFPLLTNSCVYPLSYMHIFSYPFWSNLFLYMF